MGLEVGMIKKKANLREARVAYVLWLSRCYDDDGNLITFAESLSEFTDKYGFDYANTLTAGCRLINGGRADDLMEIWGVGKWR